MPQSEAVAPVPVVDGFPVQSNTPFQYAVALDPHTGTEILVKSLEGQVRQVLVLRPPSDLLDRFCEMIRGHFSTARAQLATSGNPEDRLSGALECARKELQHEMGGE